MLARQPGREISQGSAMKVTVCGGTMTKRSRVARRLDGDVVNPAHGLPWHRDLSNEIVEYCGQARQIAQDRSNMCAGS
jgi:hypothetical protein